MLRRGVRAVAAECSYGMRREGARAAGVVLPRSGLAQSHSSQICLLGRRSGCVSYAFGTSSKKGKEREKDAAGEEQDGVIRLVSLLMKKRDILMRRKDLAINIEAAKEISDLEEVHRLWKEWLAVKKVGPMPGRTSTVLTLIYIYVQSIASLIRMTSPETEPDEEMRNMAIEEARSTLESLDELREQMKDELIPHDPIDEGSAIVEARIAIGGDESASFVGEVARMYTRYCESLIYEETGQAAFNVEEINAVPIDAVGPADAFREVILHVKGKGAYKMLRNEAGIHRVQRIPASQSSSKLQSSTIALLVLPGGKADGSDADTQVKDDIVDPKDVKTEVMRSRGAGGQHVNKTESAVRLTHEPTGITVSMQDSRSQHQNRTKAWAVLRARLQDRKMREDQSQNRNMRKSQIGGMDRSDRIRTYNFPQDRVTDHRVPINVSGIDDIINGEREGGLAYLISALRQHQEELTLQHLEQQVKEEVALVEKEASM